MTLKDSGLVPDWIDEKADPKIQIQQAISEAQQQHQALTRQAASVIGNQLLQR